MAADTSSHSVQDSYSRSTYSSAGKIFHTCLLGFVYVTLGCSRTFLIKFSMRDGMYDYIPVTVNVLSELLKFIVCGSMAVMLQWQEGGSIKSMICPFHCADILPLLKWSVPGLLYFMENLINFYVLKHLPPALAVLLGNFVIITTAVLSRCLLKRKLSRVQWASLLILFFSIVALSSQRMESVDTHRHHMVHETNQVQENEDNIPIICRHQYKHNNTHSESDKHQALNSLSGFLSTGQLLVLLQCLLSSSANVYNEKIFKEGGGMQDTIYVQNTKLYMFGIFFNSLTLCLRTDFRRRVYVCGFFHGYNGYAAVLIIVTALFGLNVSLILKFRDNMFYLMSSQLTTVTVIAASIYLFNFRPTLEFFLLTPVVLLAIYIFNAVKKMTEKTSNEGGGYELVNMEGT